MHEHNVESRFSNCELYRIKNRMFNNVISIET